MINLFETILLLGISIFTFLLIVYVYYKIRHFEFERKWLLIPAFIFLVGLIGYGVTSSNSEIDTTTKPQVEVVIESTNVVETTTVVETTIHETTESPDDFKASCQEIGYKSLLRTPDDYIGQRIVITAKVQQIMEGGWFDSNKYYRIQTDNDGYEMYFDDEYFLYDFRSDDNTKILKDDVLKIYAEFAGLEEVKRALTGAKEEIPAIKAYYVELISE